MIILNNWPDGQTDTCAGCKTKAQLEPGDARLTVTGNSSLATAGTITASWKCPGCGAARTLSQTKAQITTMAIPVQIQDPAIKALLAGKNYTPPAAATIAM